MQYTIPADNISALEKAIAKLAVRAIKLGAPEISLEILEECQTEESGIVMTSYRVEVIGESPRIADWNFIGVIEFLPDGNLINLLPSVADVDVTAYRTSTAQCDHCGLARRRTKTYLLQHAVTGMLKQVGSSCLADFTGHNDPQVMAAYAEMLMDADSAARGYAGAGSFSGYNLLNYLVMVAACADEHGWVSRSASGPGRMATAARAVMTMDHQAKCTMCRDGSLHLVITDAHRQEAKAALVWIRAMADSDLSDYLYNLQVVCRSEAVIERHTGMAASLIAAYRRAMEETRSHETQAATSLHQGIVGQRTNFDLTVLGCTPCENAYGVAYFYRLADAAGNMFIWYASNGQMETGHSYTVKATVKAHTEYRGVAQTAITRCAIVKELATA